MYDPQPGDTIETLDTPAMIIDLDLVEHNIATLVQNFKDSPATLRPHLKTAKCPEIAHMMMRAGVTKFCVAKVSEAEVMLAGGVKDLLITTEIAGRMKLKRLVELAREYGEIKVVTDSMSQAVALNEAFSQIQKQAAVLLDINVGQNRTGVQPGQPALDLANQISRLKQLRIVGVQGYEGHLQQLPDRSERQQKCSQAMNQLASTAQLLKDNGFQIDTVTTGGTGTSEFCAASQGINELQPGSFIFMDSSYRKAIDGGGYKNALTIITTVISHPEPQRAVVDAGYKSLSTDMGDAEPCQRPDLRYHPAGDEHGILEWDEGQPGVQIGDRIAMIPSHIDTTVVLHEKYYACRNGRVEAIWSVSCRGKVQ